jgi:four helix bundle protein
MGDKDLKRRCYLLSLEVIRLVESLPTSLSSKVIGTQLIRSITSIGANTVESKYAYSQKDFINFRSYALKSANESLYWLCMIRDLRLADKEKVKLLINETEEIVKILYTIIKKLRNIEK